MSISYFTKINGAGRDLWVTDGITVVGTHLVAAFARWYSSHLRRSADRLILTPVTVPRAGHRACRTSDGTAAGTVLVKDINPGCQRLLLPRLSDQRERHACSLRPMTAPRHRAVEVRRHRGRHRAGQGHQSGCRQLLRPGRSDQCERHPVLQANDGTHGHGAVEVRRHRGRDRAGQGHQSGANGSLPDPL